VLRWRRRRYVLDRGGRRRRGTERGGQVSAGGGRRAAAAWAKGAWAAARGELAATAVTTAISDGRNSFCVTITAILKRAMSAPAGVGSQVRGGWLSRLGVAMTALAVVALVGMCIVPLVPIWPCMLRQLPRGVCDRANSDRSGAGVVLDRSARSPHRARRRLGSPAGRDRAGRAAATPLARALARSGDAHLGPGRSGTSRVPLPTAREVT